MFKKIIFMLLTLIFLMSNVSFAFAEKVFTNEDLEKYKSKRDKQMTEEQKIKESERKEKSKERAINLEEKMWRNTPVPDEKKQKVIVDKE